MLRCPSHFGAPGRPVDRAHAGRELSEDRIETLHDRLLAADHHAKAALEAPHPAARSNVDVMDALGRDGFRAADVVDVIRVAAINQDVPRLEMGQEVRDGVVHGRRRDHQPHRPRLLKLLREVLKRGCACGFLLRKLLHGFGEEVIHDAIVTALDQPSHHVRAHAAQTDHPELHDCFLSSVNVVVTEVSDKNRTFAGASPMRVARFGHARPSDGPLARGILATSSALDRARHARPELLVGPRSRRLPFPQPALAYADDCLAPVSTAKTSIGKQQ